MDKTLTERISKLMEEARSFANGDGNHILYARQNNGELVVPITRDIITQLSNDIYRLINEGGVDIFTKASIRLQVIQIDWAYNCNYSKFGKDGYLAKDIANQVDGNNMCGG